MSLSTSLTPPVVANLPAPFVPASGDGSADAGRFARELDQRLRDGAREARRQAPDERADDAGRADSPEPDAPTRRAQHLGVGGQSAGHEAGSPTGKPAAFWPQGPRWPHPAGGATPAPGQPGDPETGPGLPGVALGRRPDGTIDPVADPDVCVPTDPDCELPVSVLPDDAPAPGTDRHPDRAAKQLGAGIGDALAPSATASSADPADAQDVARKASLPPPTMANLPAESPPGLPPPTLSPMPAPAPASPPLPQPELGNWPQAWPGTRAGAALGQAAANGPGKGVDGDPDGGPDGRFGARPTDPIRVPPGSPGSNAADALSSPSGAGTEQAKALRAAAQAGKATPGADTAEERAAGPIAAPVQTGARTPADPQRRGAAASLAMTAAARAAQALAGRATDPSPASAALAGQEARKLSATDATTGFVAALGAAMGAGPAGSASATGSGGVAGSPAEARLASRPGDPGFGAELGSQVSLFVRGGVQTARLMLNPAEMGPVQVQIHLDGKGAQVHLAAEHPATRQALEQAMPQLAATLRESGLTLTGGGVSEQARNFGGEATAGNGGGEPGRERRFADGNAPGRVSPGDDRLAAQASGAQRAAAARTRGVVDLVA